MSEPSAAEQVAEQIAAALAPGRFFVKPPLELRIEEVAAETRRWEIFKGELLQPDQTREEKTFRSWLLFLDEPGKPTLGPTLAVRWDQEEGKLYVCRGFAVHGHEAYGEGNVIQTRPAIKWLEERVGTIGTTVLEKEGMLEILGIQVCAALNVACRGLSRLPITSVESPLPLFSLGRFAVREMRRDEIEFETPMATLKEWLDGTGPLPSETDFTLRIAQASEIGEVAADFVRFQADCPESGPLTDASKWPPIFFSMIFDRLSLTPDVGLTTRLVELIETLHMRFDLRPVVNQYFMRLGRHLTAFDLTHFHNQGADYPDAIFLDALLRLLLQMRPSAPNLAWMRALRTGCYFRKKLERLPVPDRPTSPGDNQRVWPLKPVPEEQLQPQGRRRRLFDGEPLESMLDSAILVALRRSFSEDEPDLLLFELGRAIFLDRPLGVFKALQNWRRDQTPLVSYVAHSKSIARRRLMDAAAWGWIDADLHLRLVARLGEMPILGVSAEELSPRPRTGVVCLEDSRKAASDFVFTATTSSGYWSLGLTRELWLEKVLGALMGEFFGEPKLVIRSPRARLAAEPRAVLTWFDVSMRPRLELGLPAEVNAANIDYVEGNPDFLGFVCEEHPACGFVVLHAWDEEGRELPLPAEPIRIPPRV